MINEELLKLEHVLREKHQDIWESLRPGLENVSAPSADCATWFGWRDGQESSSGHTFLGSYRFVPYDEARDSPREVRDGSTLAQKVFLLIFARRSLYSWPLLIDGAGDGYYFSTMSHSVFYKFEGERDTVLSSFSVFVRILTSLASLGSPSEEELVEAELELLAQYSK